MRIALFIARRVAYAIGLLLAVAILNFTLIHLAPGDVVAFHQTIAALDGARAHISAGGNVAFVSLAAADQFAALDEKLRALQLSGVTLRGDAPLWSGTRTASKISHAVKAALDSENRFPSLDD